MYVLMPLKGRVPPGFDVKIAQFAVEVCKTREQRLAGDTVEVRPVLRFVLEAALRGNL